MTQISSRLALYDRPRDHQRNKQIKFRNAILLGILRTVIEGKVQPGTAQEDSQKGVEV
jgi:hypothetical protein